MAERLPTRNPLQLAIPGRRPLVLTHVILDFNGTLAVDGTLIPGVKTRLRALSRRFVVVVLTADTYGRARQVLRSVPLIPVIAATAKAKRQAFSSGVWEHTLAIGNGQNDAIMLRSAKVGVAVLGPEGATGDSLYQADIIVRDIRDALDLALHTQRLVATLRN